MAEAWRQDVFVPGLGGDSGCGHTGAQLLRHVGEGLGVELAGSFVREVDELAGIGLGHETTAQPPDPGGLENVALGELVLPAQVELDGVGGFEGGVDHFVESVAIGQAIGGGAGS